MSEKIDESDKIRMFIKEHEFDKEYYIPSDYKFLSIVANTPHYIREYFEWKGKNGL
jgi:hypothetical protein